MIKNTLLILIIIPSILFGQFTVTTNTESVSKPKKEWKPFEDFDKKFKKAVKFSTFYGAFNGNNSIADINRYSVNTGQLITESLKTPFDYSLVAGVRKIARFGYENRANVFYNGTEHSYADAATVGKVSGFEFLFEADYKRRFGSTYLDQQHFLRYVADKWIVKIEYVQQGFADIKYFEASQRYRQKLSDKLSWNIGIVQRISEPYGYNPLEEFILPNGSLHYTSLALQEGYNISFQPGGEIEYLNPEGEIVATNSIIWKENIIPQVLSNYVDRKKDEIPQQWNYSFVLGYDFYHYTKTFWIHSWASIMPFHLETGEYSYHEFIGSKQTWVDLGAGFILGYRLNKHLGVFMEGKYNKYWNRQWHDFSVGLNYVIF
tara:strand:+ start:591 stop:1715 length:1125 start_codon:yes stop_codon:yes gene_type:complete